MESQFEKLYNDLNSRLGEYIPQYSKPEEPEIDPNIVGYEDSGDPIYKDDIDSKIVSLNHHVLNISRNKKEINIKSLIDPTITGYVEFNNDDDATLAFTALDTNKNIISFLNNHYNDDLTAIEWSKIISDEMKIKHDNNKKSAASKVASNREPFNDSPDTDTGTDTTDDTDQTPPEDTADDNA